jgi:alkylation response protein AidB-like acyl-CoA dehydrogenase
MTSVGMLKPDHAARRHYDLFSEEHDDLRASIRRFVRAELTPHVDEWEERTFPNWVFPRMGELGLLGLDKPEEYGGQGGDFVSELILCEELYYGANAGLAMGVGVQVDMAMPPILAFGTEDQKQEWAAPAIAGDKVLCLGISEPDAGSDVARIKTRALRNGGDWAINGTKTYITNGTRADAIVLLTKNEPDAGYDGFTLFLVPMDTPGVACSKRLEKLGMHASDTALITFEDVCVPDSAVLGTVGKGFYQIMWELQGERLSGCAGNVSAAQRAFDLTLEYAKTRATFGKPIGSHQAIKHRLAEMAIKLEAARELTYATARRMIAGEYPVREISMTKVFTCRVANEVADDCIQLHGGAGYMKEYGIERLWRDIRLCRIGGGTDEIMLDIVGKALGL